MNIQTNNQQHIDTNFGTWRKSSRSGPNGNQCVEIAFSANAVGVRDSKQPGHGPVLAFSSNQWQSFTTSAKAGQFDQK